MRRGILITLTLVAASCGGAQRAGETDWSPEPIPADRPLRETEALRAAQPMDPKETQQRGLLGVRHDVMLSNTPHAARCSCLAVEVGAPENPSFFWVGAPPRVDPGAVVIAIGAQGIDCPGGNPDERRRRPSISAVDEDGDDIIVEIEDLPEGRPLAAGAIIPRPRPQGRIFVKPKGPNVLYGALANRYRCQVK